MKLRPKDILFQEGSKDGRLYIITRGSLIAQKREGAKSFTVGKIEEHTLVGEMSLLENLPHGLTLRASEETEVTVIGQEDLSKTLTNLPEWFPNLLHFMAERLRRAESNKEKIDKIHALPTLLFLFAKAAKGSKSGTFDLESIIDNLKVINGICYNDAYSLIRALCGLGIAELIPGNRTQIHFYKKKLPELLYKTLFARATGNTLPKELLSAGDQIVLSAFIKACKTKSKDFHGNTSVSLEDFLAAYKKVIPGIRLTARSLENLETCGFLFTEPPYSNGLDVKNISIFYADKEFVENLIELNRIYPLLDKKLPEAF
ncbi:MAG: cyclic nucleotide-binding domain-containing protein [Fibrobacteraceae bacterium]|nr:cyclic nucleotide-binding domain-containing protein [Fibrobacteraceae bacterium]